MDCFLSGLAGQCLAFNFNAFKPAFFTGLVLARSQDVSWASPRTPQQLVLPASTARQLCWAMTSCRQDLSLLPSCLDHLDQVVVSTTRHFDLGPSSRPRHHEPLHLRVRFT